MTTTALMQAEFKEVFRNPGLWILVLLPVFMSRMILQLMSGSSPSWMTLPTWILFAEVMVGLMVTGPSLIEERDSGTMDALLITPIGRHTVLYAKGMVVVILSLLSQALVLVVNMNDTSHLLMVLPVMLVGSILMTEVGMLIGLVVRAPKNGSAVSSAFMIVLFLTGAVHRALPDPHHLLRILPGVDVVTNMEMAMQAGKYQLDVSVFLVAWIIALCVLIEVLTRRQFR